MNKRKDLLNAFKAYVHSKADSLNLQGKWNRIEASKFLLEIQNYYKYKDIETNSTHYVIFTMLYIDSNDYTYDEISLQCNISIKTLDRYRQGYNSFAKKLIELNEILISIGQKLSD